jgi:hypothetical protein
MWHFTSFFLNSKSNVLVKRALFLLNAALAIVKMKRCIFIADISVGIVTCNWFDITWIFLAFLINVLLQVLPGFPRNKAAGV